MKREFGFGAAMGLLALVIGCGHDQNATTKVALGARHEKAPSIESLGSLPEPVSDLHDEVGTIVTGPSATPSSAPSSAPVIVPAPVPSAAPSVVPSLVPSPKPSPKP